jgi:hypothetical protein
MKDLTLSNAATKLDQFARRNSTGVIVGATVIASGLGLLIWALRPPKSQNRAAALLDGIHDRLHDAVEPVYRRASQAASNGTKAVREGAERLGDLRPERMMRGLSRKVRDLFP